ncbi:MAG: putative manganese transporter [Amylibacter sp.]|nr:putative manganese transporter [Amylibacter sp.]
MKYESIKKSQNNWINSSIGPFRTKRLILILILFTLSIFPSEIGEYTRAALEDAYIGVSVFVAITLAFFYFAEKISGNDISELFKKAKFAQVPLASFMGALPGCGGAVVVVAAYSSGSVSLGAVVATLTATMGDAAFLLIAKRPDVAIVLLPTSFIVGIITGYIVDIFDKTRDNISLQINSISLINVTKNRQFLYVTYSIIVIPGFIFAVLGLLQYEFEEHITQFITIISFIGISTGMLIWATSSIKTMTNPKETTISRVSEETSFITAWVILAFLLFEYSTNIVGLDLQSWFETVGILVPLIAILIGFIPGCGPQILVTTFYINGLIPFAALIGNSIANDGDALFPAIAINPKIAIIATIYSSIPAVIVAYGFYFYIPNYLTP